MSNPLWRPIGNNVRDDSVYVRYPDPPNGEHDECRCAHPDSGRPALNRRVFDGDAIVSEIPRLRRYARALVGDPSAADDLVQDTLERAWGKRSLWRAGSDMRAWLFGIMHNLRVDHVRKHPQPTVPLDDEHMMVPTPATQSERLELRDLTTALARLPEEQRQVLLLVAIEEMSYEEVARTAGIPIGTVMSRLSRGRERLRLILQGQHQPAALKVVK